MNTGMTLLSVVAMTCWLFLAVRAYRAQGQSFERTALTIVVWVILFAVIAVVAGHFITRQPV